MLDLTAYRSRFSSLNHCHYLISNSLGAMPNRARDLARQYADTWMARGVRAWSEAWWDLPRQVGDKIGALMHAEPDTVSMHLNVTSAQATVLSCFDFSGPRNKVVMVDMEFPSILYLYDSWLRDRGRLEIIPCPDGITAPIEEVLKAIDDTTQLVAISHVLFRSACIVEAEAIIDKAHKVGALVVLDIFQSLGTVPVDVIKLNVDFAVGGCLKWLCGGPGACFLYVRPDLHSKLNPRFTGWIAHENPFAFAPPPTTYTTGSYKFMNGTPNIPALYTCQPGLDIVAEVGIDTIRRRSIEMTTRLLKRASERGWAVTASKDSARRGGTAAIDVPHGDAIAAELCARNFLVDYRPKAGVRISPHFYNTDVEIDEVMAEIESIISERAYEKQKSAKRTVT
jgi:kynureninase